MLQDPSPTTLQPSYLHNGDSSKSTCRDPKPEISKLSQDLLWCIFSIIADLDNDNQFSVSARRRGGAVDVLRITSQVCHDWREQILGLPSMWGRMLDLDALCQASGQWREEILRRSRDSPLFVKGRLRHRSPSLRKFFISVIHDHWHRIKKLDVVIDYAHSIPDDTWKVFQYPAKILQSFHLEVDIWPSLQLPIDIHSRLFSDDVPALRELQFRQILADITAPCFSQLHKLELSFFSANDSFSLSHLFNAFATMPLLEALTLQCAVRSDQHPTSGSFGHISLPRLQDMCIRDSVASCSAILEHIAPHFGCALNLNLFGSRVTNTELTSLLRPLSRYIEDYIKAHETTTLEINVSQQDYQFHVRKSASTDFGGFFTSISFMLCDDQPEPGYSLLINMLLNCGLANLSVLGIDIDSYLQVFSEPPHPCFYNLLSSFAALETLVTTEQSLLSVTEIAKNIASGLPLLHTVAIRRAPTFVSPPTMPFNHYMSPFLTWRRKIGSAIRTLDLKTREKRQSNDLEFLDEFTGMTVLWVSKDDVKEYICGSGKPEEIGA